MSPLDARYDQARISALGVLALLVEGKTGVLVAARQLAGLRFALVGDELDDDWGLFVGIDSETDHLPTGAERRHWAADALVEKDAEIQKADEFYRARAIEAARRLIQRYEKSA